MILQGSVFGGGVGDEAIFQTQEELLEGAAGEIAKQGEDSQHAEESQKEIACGEHWQGMVDVRKEVLEDAESKDMKEIQAIADISIKAQCSGEAQYAWMATVLQKQKEQGGEKKDKRFWLKGCADGRRFTHELQVKTKGEKSALSRPMPRVHIRTRVRVAIGFRRRVAMSAPAARLSVTSQVAE